jgi:hypothetical protein
MWPLSNWFHKILYPSISSSIRATCLAQFNLMLYKCHEEKTNREMGLHVVPPRLTYVTNNWDQAVTLLIIFGRCPARISARTSTFLNEVSMTFLSRFKYLKLGHDCFFRHTFNFIIHSIVSFDDKYSDTLYLSLNKLQNI